MGTKLSDWPKSVQKQVRQQDHDRRTSGINAFKGDCQKIFIGSLPPMLNGDEGLQRMHWTMYEKHRENWKWHIKRKNPEKHLGKVNIRFTRISTSCPDPDNVSAGFKVVGDALVDAGVIEDDSFKVIKNFDVRWKKADSMREQGVLIEIEDVE